jgi:hypothetical protein
MIKTLSTRPLMSKMKIESSDSDCRVYVFFAVNLGTTLQEEDVTGHSHAQKLRIEY